MNRGRKAARSERGLWKLLSKKIVWKFNIIDILLILIVLISIISLIYKSTFGSSDAQLQTFYVTYVCESTPAEVVGSIKAGDSCMDGDSNISLGVLTESNSEPLETPAPPTATPRDEASSSNDEGDGEDGAGAASVESENSAPGKSRAVFTTEVEAYKYDHGIYIEDSVYVLGKQVNLVIGDAIFDSYVSNIAAAPSE